MTLSKHVRHWIVMKALENAPRGMTVTELVERFPEIKRRTTTRDLDELSEVGFPLQRTSDHHWHIEGPTVQSMPVQSDHIIALGVAAQFLRTGAPWLVKPLEYLRMLFEATLDPKRAEYCRQMEACLAAGPAGEGLAAHAAEAAETFRSALDMEQWIEMAYEGRDQVVRTHYIAPYGLHVLRNRTYLIGWSKVWQKYLSFVACRVHSITIKEDPFIPRTDFDLETFVAENIGGYGGPMYDYVLQWSPQVAFLANERIFHPKQVATVQPDGHVQVRFQARGLPVVAAEVAGYGGELVALEPPELIQAVHQSLQASWQAHGFSDSSP